MLQDSFFPSRTSLLFEMSLIWILSVKICETFILYYLHFMSDVISAIHSMNYLGLSHTYLDYKDRFSPTSRAIQKNT